MLEDKFVKWQQKKRDITYRIAVGDWANVEEDLHELLEYTFTHWSDIRNAQDESVCPAETGQVVHTKTL